jgi:hypothetical protein
MLIFIYFLYPETSVYTLEEVSIVFDGPQTKDVYADKKGKNDDHDVVEERIETIAKN